MILGFEGFGPSGAELGIQVHGFQQVFVEGSRAGGGFRARRYGI